MNYFIVRFPSAEVVPISLFPEFLGFTHQEIPKNSTWRSREGSNHRPSVNRKSLLFLGRLIENWSIFDTRIICIFRYQPITISDRDLLDGIGTLAGECYAEKYVEFVTLVNSSMTRFCQHFDKELFPAWVNVCRRMKKI